MFVYCLCNTYCVLPISVGEEIRVRNDRAEGNRREEAKVFISMTVSSALISLKQASGV